MAEGRPAILPRQPARETAERRPHIVERYIAAPPYAEAEAKLADRAVGRIEVERKKLCRRRPMRTRLAEFRGQCDAVVRVDRERQMAFGCLARAHLTKRPADDKSVSASAAICATICATDGAS